MLPTSEGFNPTGKELWKFADTAIPELLKKMEQLGANKFRIKAKIAGGAQMFPGFNNTSLSSIGDRNIVAVKEVLKQNRIPILAEDVGKDYGRTQFFDSSNGEMRIKAALRGEWVY
jgi:chemotaxis protein CheD